MDFVVSNDLAKNWGNSQSFARTQIKVETEREREREREIKYQVVALGGKIVLERNTFEKAESGNVFREPSREREGGREGERAPEEGTVGWWWWGIMCRAMTSGQHNGCNETAA